MDEDRWEYEQYVEEMERAYDEMRDDLFSTRVQQQNIVTGLENTIEIGGE